MKNLLVTLDINYPKEITNLTFPFMEMYAKNNNCDFKIIKKRRFKDLPIPMEKFQLYDLSHNYNWTLFLDADCLINPKTMDLFNVVESDIVVVCEYLDILNSPNPQFQTKNVMGNLYIDIHTPFSFLLFHNSQKNVVKMWDNPLQFAHYVNLTESMIKFGKSQEWHLDEFLLAVNIVKFGINTLSLKTDFPNTVISHNGNYLTLNEKIIFLNQCIDKLKQNVNFFGAYV